MAVTYDLKTDIRYMQGEKNAKLSLIKKALEKSPRLSNQQIAERFFLDINEVEILRREV